MGQGSKRGIVRLRTWDGDSEPVSIEPWVNYFILHEMVNLCEAPCM